MKLAPWQRPKLWKLHFGQPVLVHICPHLSTCSNLSHVLFILFLGNIGNHIGNVSNFPNHIGFMWIWNIWHISIAWQLDIWNGQNDENHRTNDGDFQELDGYFQPCHGFRLSGRSHLQVARLAPDSNPPGMAQATRPAGCGDTQSSSQVPVRFLWKNSVYADLVIFLQLNYDPFIRQESSISIHFWWWSL